jgi:hypothetical protein
MGQDLCIRKRRWRSSTLFDKHCLYALGHAQRLSQYSSLLFPSHSMSDIMVCRLDSDQRRPVGNRRDSIDMLSLRIRRRRKRRLQSREHRDVSHHSMRRSRRRREQQPSLHSRTMAYNSHRFHYRVAIEIPSERHRICKCLSVTTLKYCELRITKQHK